MTNARTAARCCGATLLALMLLAWSAAAATQSQTNKTRVDVNSANLATLESLPGVGPTLAQRIIDGRPYKSLEDLEKVKGLSKSKVAALKDQVVFGPPARTVSPSTTTSPLAAAKPGASTNMAPDKQAAGKTKSMAKSTAAGAAAENAAAKGQATATKAASAKSSGKLAAGQKLNINKASYQELDALPGIGPTKAQAIIDYRTQNGPFKTIEDIQKVKGIKAGSFDKIKELIKVSD